MTEDHTPKMGRYSAGWRRFLYRFFANSYFRRKVTTPDGACAVYVSPGAQLNVLRPSGVRVDPVHTRFIARWVKEDSVVWDVRGNIGLFSFPVALKARRGQVYAFEPDITLAYNLLRSKRLAVNQGLPITLMPFALSNTDDIAEFLIAAYGNSMNKLAGVGAWHDNLFVASEKRTVVTLRIDSIARHLRPPDVIKIDVEGAEMLVLEGGKETIAKSRPVMLIEGPKELGPAMKAYLKELDYVMVDGFADDPVLIDEIAWDTVAIPRERWK